MKQDLSYYDVTLATLAYRYMVLKRMKLTTGNLFSVMKKILNRIDIINKNEKILIQFSNAVCKIDSEILGERR